MSEQERCKGLTSVEISAPETSALQQVILLLDSTSAKLALKSLHLDVAWIQICVEIFAKQNIV